MTTMKLNVPMADYHADRTHLSSSAIKCVCHKDLWEFKRRYIDSAPDRTETDAMRRGRAVHAMLDGTFQEVFEIVPKLSKGKPAHEINETMTEAATEIYTSLIEHPEVARIISTDGALFEPTYYSSQDGIKVKARPDLVVGGCAYDLKTVENPQIGKFKRAVYSYGWHISAAMVLSVAELEQYRWIAIEAKFPFRVVIHECQDATRQLGLRAYLAAIEKLKTARALDDYPQIDAGIQPLELDDWAFSAELKGEDNE